MSEHVVVVGAGLGGLAAAAHLVGRGYRVTVVERGDAPGGRAGELRLDGYRFDTGPAVLTMRDLLADVFTAAGARLEDHVALRRVEPAYRARFWDGSDLAVHTDRDRMTEEIRAAAGAHDADGFGRFVDWVTELYRVEFPNFIARDFRTPADLLRTPGALVDLVRLGGFGKLQGRVDDFFTDERLRRLFSFQAMYAGLSPLRALALFAVIAYMDTVEGVWFPEGGMHAAATGLAEALTAAGVEFRYGTTVETVRPGRPVEVVTADGVLRADAAVLNPDLARAYPDLLGVKPPLPVRVGRSSPSCIVWLIGTRGHLPDIVAHHNIHFAESWAPAFDELLDRGRPMSDPSRFVTVASRTDPTAAPDGGHTLYVLEPVPHLGHDVDWQRATPELTERMLTWARAEGYLHGEPEVMHITDPPAWRAQGMGRGTPFAFDHRFTQSGPFRPALTDRRLPGVVFVGSGTRPGVGVPMVLVSGRLAADAVDRVRRG